MNIKYKSIYFYIILSIFFIIQLYLFYRFCNTNYEMFVSDFQWHLEASLSFANNTVLPFESHQFPHQYSYPLFHITTALLYSLTNRIDLSASLIAALSNIATIILVRKHGKMYVNTDLKKYLLDIFAITIVLIMPISGILTDYKPMFPQMSINPWHNPTYMFMRPFTIITFYLFIDLINKFNSNKIKINDWIIFGLVLFITTLAKPNFTIFFLFASGIHTALLIIKNPKKYFTKYSIPLLVTVFPTLILLILQNIFVRTYSEFTFSMSLLSLTELKNKWFIFLRYFISLQLFNLIFFIYKGKNILFKDLEYYLSFTMFIPTAFIWFFTTQGLVNLTNYAWSYEITTFFLYVFSAYILLKYSNNIYFNYIFILIYSINIYYGIKYFYYLLQGWNFTSKF